MNRRTRELSRGLLAWAIAGAALVAGRAGAATIELAAWKDTMIFQNHANARSAGGAPGFFAGTNSEPSIRRGLVAFDLAPLPSGAIVTAVQLRLKIGQLAGSAGGPNPPGVSGPVIGLHKLLVHWGEAGAGRSTADSLNGIGQGSPVEDGDATWANRVYREAQPSEAWSAPGGAAGVDYVGAASAVLPQADTLNAYSLWTSTPALVADVQSWVDDPAANHGWMLINADETARQTFRGFYSRDFNPETPLPDLESYFPSLEVTYVIPEPASIVLLAVGMGTAAISLFRRRRGRA